jgi:hypothetical protein
MEDVARIEWTTFIIRLRRETQGSGWHGQIVHLASQTDRHFITLAEAMDFLAEHTPGLAGQTAERPTTPATEAK